METQTDLAWALLTELRKEIVASQNLRATIVGFKITFVSSATALIVANLKTVDPLLFVIPAFAAIFFDFLINSYSIAVKRNGRFIREFIEPKLRERFAWPPREPLWEEFMAEPRNKQVLSLIGNLGITLIATTPAAVVLAMAGTRWYAIALGWTLGVLLAFDIVSFLKPRWLVEARS